MVGPRVKSYFLSYGLKKLMIDEFLANYFKDAGYAGVEVFRTPTGHRVVIYAEYPGRLIGRGGSVIKKLTTILQTRFGLENVNITVSPVMDPDLNARVVAFRIVRALEKEIPFRRVMMGMLKRIMDAGAVGAEIIISGKLRGERATYEKMRVGKIYKVGEPVEYIIDRAVARALLKPGIYGVEVLIVKPGIKLPDHVEIKPVKPEALKQEAQQAGGVEKALQEGGGVEGQ
ncbi:MAG: 30S ribosomal protein S3 [Thermosphaera aggregans]|jgi:small subunit ribosomal protein S3|uniref:30S ribosomal protein S3 n=1 Tax=Thermosphaera aggregans TaxID=54254 RepID=UPI003C109F22